MRCLPLVALLVSLLFHAFSPPAADAQAKPAQPAAKAAAPAKTPDSKYEMVTVRGRVGWLADFLSRRHGVRTVPESRERILALETRDGKLYPLVEDIRGRAFRRDKRLRDVELELVTRRHSGSPFLQVIKVYQLKGGKAELDYWCEICSIAMFELKECDCCQGPIELRRRPATGP